MRGKWGNGAANSKGPSRVEELKRRIGGRLEAGECHTDPASRNQV